MNRIVHVNRIAPVNRIVPVHLSFRECIDTCRAYESTSAQMRDMKIKDATVCFVEARKKTLQRPQGNETRKAKDTARYQQQQRKCKYCGKDHQWGRDYCPAYGKQCKECLKMHHFSRMCKSSSKRKPKGAVRKLHVIESQTETDTDSDEFDSHDEYVVSIMTLTPQTEEVNAIRNSTTYERKLYTVMKVGRKLVKFQIDMGATCNVLKQSDLPQKATIKQTAQVLTLFNGHKDEAPWEDDCESDKPKNKQVL